MIAWNVTGEVSASNGTNNFSQNLLRNFPSPPTWIDDATGREAGDLPRARRSPTHRGSG